VLYGIKGLNILWDMKMFILPQKLFSEKLGHKMKNLEYEYVTMG
jgi:hypothetical protein